MNEKRPQIQESKRIIKNITGTFMPTNLKIQRKVGDFLSERKLLKVTPKNGYFEWNNFLEDSDMGHVQMSSQFFIIIIEASVVDRIPKISPQDSSPLSFKH